MNIKIKKDKIQSPENAIANTLPLNGPGLPVNLNIPNLFVEIAHMTARHDGICTLSFYSKLPGQNLEVARVTGSITLFESLKTVIEQLSDGIKAINK
jgi:hypothetical protein